MARLYLDHNVSLNLVPALQSEGHDIVTSRSRGLTRLTDDAHILAAARERRVLVTHDREDFTLLHDAWLSWPAAFTLTLPPHAGIVILDPAPHDELSRALNTFLTDMPSEVLQNQLYRWHRRDSWYHRVVGNRWELLAL